MKVKFHLFSINMNCGHCTHRKLIPGNNIINSTSTKVRYCFIISSIVEENYCCSFYRLKTKPKPKTNETKDKTILPTNTDDEGNENRGEV